MASKPVSRIQPLRDLACTPGTSATSAHLTVDVTVFPDGSGSVKPIPGTGPHADGATQSAECLAELVALLQTPATHSEHAD